MNTCIELATPVPSRWVPCQPKRPLWYCRLRSRRRHLQQGLLHTGQSSWTPHLQGTPPYTSTSGRVSTYCVRPRGPHQSACQSRRGKLAQDPAQPFALGGVDDSSAGPQSAAARQAEVPVAKVLGNVLTRDDPKVTHQEVRRHWRTPYAVLGLGVYSILCVCASSTIAVFSVLVQCL